MAKKWDYGVHAHKKKMVKGFYNGKPVNYDVTIWKHWYDTSDTKNQYYSVSWQIAGSWSFSAGYGKEIKTKIKTLQAANTVVTSTTNKIKKMTNPYK